MGRDKRKENSKIQFRLHFLFLILASWVKSPFKFSHNICLICSIHCHVIRKFWSPNLTGNIRRTDQRFSLYFQHLAQCGDLFLKGGLFDCLASWMGRQTDAMGWHGMGWDGWIYFNWKDWHGQSHVRRDT